MLEPGRYYSVANTNYRYGFNGQEKSTEINGSSYTAEFWQYDSRIGRRWNIDPMNGGSISPYAAFNNNAVMFSDLLGLDTVNSSKKAGNGDVFEHQHGNSNFFWDKTKNGWIGGGESGNLAEVRIKGRLKKDLPPLALVPYQAYNYTKEQGTQWDLDYSNFEKGDYTGLTSTQLSMYKMRDESRASWKMMSFGIVGVLGTGGLGAAAPGLFTISTEMAGTKGAISWIVQASFNGRNNVDYAHVASDAFTAPGLGALINGGISWRPFSERNQIRIIGVNKSLSQFSIDAGTTFIGGLGGEAIWKPLRPLLKNSSEKTILYFSTQSWLNATSQGANKIATDASKKK